MRLINHQKRVEEIVYDSIDELAEEFNLTFPYYPSVQYVGKGFGLRFEDLNLPESDRKIFDCLMRSCPVISVYDRMIVYSVGSRSPTFLHEEAAHFLHSKNSRIRRHGHDEVETDKILIMKEMLGFFGALCLGKRRNPFKITPDLYNEYPKALDFTDRLENECGFDDGQIHDYWVHKQGYSMGQMLFAEYSSGRIPKDRITRLFRESFSRSGRANAVFREVRTEIGWPMKV